MKKSILIPILILLVLCSVSTASWVDSSYNYKRNITNEGTSNLAFAVNGTAGFGGHTIWTNPSMGDLEIYYNDTNTYIITNQTLQIPFETEGGGLNNSITSIFSPDIVLVYHFDNSSGNMHLDSSGHYNLVNFTGISGTSNAVFGNGIDFNSANIKVDAAKVTTNQNRTITFWIDLDTNSSEQVISDHWVDGTGMDYTIRIKDSNDGAADGRLSFSTLNTAGTNHFASIDNLAQDTYYFICAITNGSNSSVYLNGAYVDSVTITGTTRAGTGKLNLGAYFTGVADLNGQMDEYRLYNRSLSSNECLELYTNSLTSGAGAMTLGAEESQALGINFEYPSDNNIYNDYNGWLNWSTDVATNCSINDTRWAYISDNTTYYAYYNISAAEGDYSINISCNDGSNNASAILDFIIDNTDPTITWNNPSATNDSESYLTLNSNITISDYNLYSYYYNITWPNGTVIASYSNTSLTGLTSYTITNSPNLTGYGGVLNAVVKVCDGHTDNEISFDVIKDELNKKLLFEEVKIYSKDGTDLSLDYQKKPDRYTFEFIAPQYTATKTFIVESDEYIDILNGKTKYSGHLITGNKWIDFEMPGIKNLAVKRIDDKKVEVIIDLINPANKWSFNSIGELNCINETATFLSINTTEDYDTPILGGSNQTFSLNVTYNSTYYTASTATLYWNGTAYSGTKTAYSTYNNFVATVPVPNVAASTNISFYWTFSADSTYYNISNKTQEIYAIGIDNCSTYTTRAFNFSIYNETADSAINGTMAGWFKIWIDNDDNYKEYNLTWAINDSAPSGLCISPAWADFTMYAQMEYEATGFDSKDYYFYNTNVDNVTENYIFYLTGGTSQVSFSVRDENDDAVEGVYIKVLSYDITTDSSKVTEIVKTDFLGVALAQIVKNTQWYVFILEYNGQVVLQTSPTIITADSNTFRINLVSDYFDSYEIINGVATSLTYSNDTTTFTYTFSDSSNSITEGCLKVIKRSINGDTTLYNSCTASAAATITYNISEAGALGSNTYIGTGYININPSFVTDVLTASYNLDWQTYGDSGIFVTLLLVIALVLVGLWNPIVAIVLMVVGVVVITILGFFYLAWPILVSFVIMAAITIFKMGRRV